MHRLSDTEKKAAERDARLAACAIRLECLLDEKSKKETSKKKEEEKRVVEYMECEPVQVSGTGTQWTMCA